MEAMRKGEEWALPLKDRGPVKALARDYVDSRRIMVSEYILFAIFLLIIAVFIVGHGKSSNSYLVLLIEFGIVAIIALESLYHGFRVSRLAKERFPEQSTRGVTWYVCKRAVKLRSSRIPPARVARGQAI
jgi:DUF3043 family protein